MAPDWATISSLATAGGTLVLAVATFAAVRSANRAARVAEQALLVGLRPMLVPSRLDDTRQKVFFGDGRAVLLPGGGAAVIADEDTKVIYLAVSLRNAGSGIAVMRGWHYQPGQAGAAAIRRPDLSLFRRHFRDLYIAPNDIGFWQGAVREAGDEQREAALTAIADGRPLIVDMLYGDHEGGQRDQPLRPAAARGRRGLAGVGYPALEPRPPGAEGGDGAGSGPGRVAGPRSRRACRDRPWCHRWHHEEDGPAGRTGQRVRRPRRGRRGEWAVTARIRRR